MTCKKTTWRTHHDHTDYEVAMRKDSHQRKAATQLDLELKELDKRLAELDWPDVETDQKRVGKIGYGNLCFDVATGRYSNSMCREWNYLFLTMVLEDM